MRTVFLDSGAFSAWKSGTEILLSDYIAFLEEPATEVDYFFTLDVIPKSEAEFEAAAKASFKNSTALVRAGHRPIPVYHQGERAYWLERMIDEGYDYIALSPRKVLPVPQRKAFVRGCFDLMAARGVIDKVRTHGLGVTASAEYLSFPFTSIDSQTATYAGIRGMVLFPRLQTGALEATRPEDIPVRAWEQHPLARQMLAKMREHGWEPAQLRGEHILRVALSAYAQSVFSSNTAPAQAPSGFFTKTLPKARSWEIVVAMSGASTHVEECLRWGIQTSLFTFAAPAHRKLDFRAVRCGRAPERCLR